MNRAERSPAIVWFVGLSLLVGLCCGTPLTGSAQTAQEGVQPSQPPQPDQFAEEPLLQGSKVSPDLTTPTAKSAGDEGFTTQAATGDLVSVIIQLNKPMSGRLNGFLHSHAVEKGRYVKLNFIVVEIAQSNIQALASFPEVRYVSMDRDVKLHGHVETTSGAWDMRQHADNLGLNGSGIGIAVLDSGIWADHNLFGSNGRSRVAVSVDFTGLGLSRSDPYGHGTHVAGLAAGDSSDGMTTAYTGIAPGASIIDLRVLDSQGNGKASYVLSALDWIMNNRAAYNIRVVNMSLGCLAIDSYINDPLCLAVRRLVDAGIVCVAAAGNNGKDSLGNKQYGMIHSPGNEPSAITVGAANTYGTDARDDDGVASYSSRGPTRSYWTDTQGNKHYDNLVKPEIVGPGNRIYSGEAAFNALVTANPQLANPYNHSCQKATMSLSGTSMATPIVAGAAALMLQANPSLTPSLIKAILMYTAQPLVGFNMLEQGAGEVNIEGAVRLAKLVRTDLNSGTPLGAPLLITPTPPTAQSTIAGQTFNWGQGIISKYTYITGVNLITQYQLVYGQAMLLSDGVLVSNGLLVSNSMLLGDGIVLGNSILISNGMLLGDGAAFLPCALLLGDGMLLGDRTAIGDGILLSDANLLGDALLLGDAVAQSSTAQMTGDAGASMPPSPSP